MNVAKTFRDSDHPDENADRPEDASDSFGDEIVKRVMPKLSKPIFLNANVCLRFPRQIIAIKIR